MIIDNAVESTQDAFRYRFKPEELLTPTAFAHPVSRLEVRETNTSWVILTGLYAYKVKKSVNLGFIDASTLERRRFLCAEELRLNRRLALDLYLDVVTISREAGDCGRALKLRPYSSTERRRHYSSCTACQVRVNPG